MSQTTQIPGPMIPAVALFRRIAPTYAVELSCQLHRTGLQNTNDLITVLTSGLVTFSREQNVHLATEFPKAWPEALQALRTARTEEEWEQLLPQTSRAPQAKSHKLALGVSQMIRVLEVSRETVHMSPHVATALGIWIVTAVVIAHSGPLDADLSLEQLADCL